SGRRARAQDQLPTSLLNRTTGQLEFESPADRWAEFQSATYRAARSMTCSRSEESASPKASTRQRVSSIASAALYVRHQSVVLRRLLQVRDPETQHPSKAFDACR